MRVLIRRRHWPWIPGFDMLMDQHIQLYKPINHVELGVIEDMVASLWRLHRTVASIRQLAILPNLPACHSS